MISSVVRAFGARRSSRLCGSKTVHQFAAPSAFVRCHSSMVIPDNMQHTVGVVRSDEPFQLASGQSLPAGSMQIKYATWGNPENPAVLVCPSMSNSVYATDSPTDNQFGWWREIIGPGDQFGIDTSKYFVICGAAMGGPFGSTSPITTNPETGKHWGGSFPQITIEDIAAGQNLLLESLGIDKVFAVVGGSMGGMQVIQFAAKFPEKYERFAAIAATGQTPPSTVALRSVQRAAVQMDPAYEGGNYELGQGPRNGMAVARKFGTICYRSRTEFDKRFDWFPDENQTFSEGEGAFEVERYLEYQAKKFTSVVNYDANCYLLLSRAMDRMDIGSGCNCFRSGVERIPPGKEGMLLGYDTDTLTPASDMEYLSSVMGKNGVRVHYEELKSKYGHDAFLVTREAPGINFRLRAFLCPDEDSGVDAVHKLIKDMYEH